ncbi:sensor histidine kinase [Prauserella rugosa]|uniref:histidine kinase n=1 Tax=Prauserella rugosa TaxID=43354 RepID=A0A660CHD8_9PSEU|nr:histidine kinase [Prauserella rugosa]TWH20451.1 signal transduction histidine kinase [Prauserella rugosa]
MPSQSTPDDPAQQHPARPNREQQAAARPARWWARVPPLAVRALAPIYAVTYLLVLAGTPAGPREWALSLASAGLLLAGGRLPTVVALAQAPLFLLAVQTTVSASHLVPLFAAASLAELVYRRRGPVLWACVAGAAGVVAPLIDWADPPLGVVRVLLAVGSPVVAGAWLRAQRGYMRQAEERAEEAERTKLIREQAARAEERTAIARELHDVVAHHVASISLRVGVARHVVSTSDPQVTAVLDDVHATAATALTDLRRLVAVLRGGPDDAPGDSAGSGARRLALTKPAALEAELRGAAQRARSAGIDVTADIAPTPPAMDALCGATVLRIAQEGLTNVLKHAGAGAQARLTVHYDDGAAGSVAVVEVADSGGGSGAPDPHVAEGGGHGLVGMAERVALVGGRLEAERHGQGWRLHAEVPVDAERSSA